MPVALQPGEGWSLDFVSDRFGASRKFRILAVNEDCCRENLRLMADTSISGARVVRELDALVRVYGKPACIVSDNGTEFTSRAILKWAGDNGVDWPSGDTTTTTSDHTHLLQTKHLQKRVERLGNLRTQHTTRLPKTKPQIMKSKPADSHYE